MFAVVPCELGGEELIARFICATRHFSKVHNRPKPGAFSPEPYNELSVAHVTNLGDPDVWNIAARTLVDQPGRDKVYARADAPIAEFMRHKLRAVRDDNPFERHTLVLGWPNPKDPNERKEQWKLICLQLSQSPAVTLVVPDQPVRLERSEERI